MYWRMRDRDLDLYARQRNMIHSISMMNSNEHINRNWTSKIHMTRFNEPWSYKYVKNPIAFQLVTKFVIHNDMYFFQTRQICTVFENFTNDWCRKGCTQQHSVLLIVERYQCTNNRDYFWKFVNIVTKAY